MTNKQQEVISNLINHFKCNNKTPICDLCEWYDNSNGKCNVSTNVEIHYNNEHYFVVNKLHPGDKNRGNKCTDFEPIKQ